MVMGQRQTKREPIVASSAIKESGIKVGDMIDDGTNHPLKLATGFPQSIAEAMLGHLEERYTKKQWKFWII